MLLTLSLPEQKVKPMFIDIKFLGTAGRCESVKDSEKRNFNQNLPEVG